MLYHKEKVEIAENILRSNATHLASLQGKLIAYTEMQHSQQIDSRGQKNIIIPKEILLDIIKDLNHCSNQSCDYLKECIKLYDNPIKSL